MGLSAVDVSPEERRDRGASCRRITTASVNSGLDLEILGPSLAYQSRLWVPDQLFIDGSSFFIKSGLGVDGRDGGELLLIVIYTTGCQAVPPTVVEFLISHGASLETLDRYSRGTLELMFLSLGVGEPWIRSPDVSIREFDNAVLITHSKQVHVNPVPESWGREMSGFDATGEMLTKATTRTAMKTSEGVRDGNGRNAPLGSCLGSRLDLYWEEATCEHLCPVLLQPSMPHPRSLAGPQERYIYILC